MAIFEIRYWKKKIEFHEKTFLLVKLIINIVLAMLLLIRNEKNVSKIEVFKKSYFYQNFVSNKSLLS